MIIPEPKDLVPSSQKLNIEPYPDPDESSP
jgi:hypothetical protein